MADLESDGPKNTSAWKRRTSELSELLTWCNRMCAGGLYYRYRPGYGVEPGYPRSLSVWRNVRRPVDAAFQYRRVTYFLSRTVIQSFDDSRFTVGYAQHIYRPTLCNTFELNVQYTHTHTFFRKPHNRRAW